MALPTAAERQARRLAANPDLIDMTDAELLAEKEEISSASRAEAILARRHRSARKSPAQLARTARQVAIVGILRERGHQV